MGNKSAQNNKAAPATTEEQKPVDTSNEQTTAPAQTEDQTGSTNVPVTSQDSASAAEETPAAHSKSITIAKLDFQKAII